MIPTSIRWRLPISYAAIALLATLSLGAILLTTLRTYYAQQELNYLKGNASAISLTLSQSPLTQPEWLTLQLKSFAFLSRVRIRLLDNNGNTISDSGTPPDQRLISVAQAHTSETSDDQLFTGDILLMNPPRYQATLIPQILFFGDTREQERHKTTTPTTGEIFTFPATDTLYGFYLDRELLPASQARSDQVVRVAIEHTDGTPVGYVELSEGPAYGSEIVSGVARAWATASAAAVIIAGGVGLIISQRISAPLITLTDTTASMSGGNLSARANIDRQDEFGTLARSFNDMADRVEETIMTLRRFVADAAHELHTPLTALRTNLELISLEENTIKRQAFLERAQGQAVRLESLTTDLLELSRIEASINHADYPLINLSDLVQETSELYASQAEQKNIEFALDLPQEKDTPYVKANERQIRRVVCNLLENAIKFTPEGGAVRLGARQQNTYAEIWVEDTGIGIPPEDLPLLFSRFHRGRNAVNYPGSGLGLAIVKAIADFHKGQVSAENRSPGARLSLRLPIT